MNIEPAIVQETRKLGHDDIFTPPHLSDLQPIKLIWARIKSSIARSYSKTTTLQNVKDRLDEESNILETAESRSVIRNIVQHVDKIINKFHMKIGRS